MAANLVGRVAIRVLPDTKMFRKDLLKALKRIENSVHADIPLRAQADAKSAAAAGRQAARIAHKAVSDIKITPKVDPAKLADDFRDAAKAAEKAAGNIKVDPKVDKSKLINDARDAVKDAEKASPKIQPEFEVKQAGLIAATRAAVAAASKASGRIWVSMSVNPASVIAMTVAVKAAVAAANMFGGSIFKNLIKELPNLIGLASVATVAIGGLGGPLLGIVAAAGSAAGALLNLTGALAPAAIVAAGMAVGVLAVAFRGMGDAISADSLDEFNAAIADMPASAQEGARAIRGLKEEFEGIGDVIQNSFWMHLQNLGDLASLIEPFQMHMRFLAMNMAKAASSVVDFVSHGTGLDAMSRIMENASLAASSVVGWLGQWVEGMIALGAAGAPILAELTAGFTEAGRAWRGDMVAGFEDGSLEEKLRGFVDTLSSAGDTLSSLGGIISGVFNAAVEGSGSALGALGTLVEKTDEWVNSVEGQEALVDFFASMSSAVEAVSPALGELASIIGSTVAPAIADFLEAAGPGLTTAMEALGDALEIIAPHLEPLGEAFGDILIAAAPLLPIIAELVVAFLPLVPVIVWLVEQLALFLEAIAPLLPIIAVFAAVIFLAANPVWLVVAAVVAIIAVLTWLISKLPEAWEAVKEWASNTWEKAKEMGVKVAEAVLEMVDKVKQFFIDLHVAALQKMVEFVTGIRDKFVEMKDKVVETASQMKTDIINRITEMWDGFKEKTVNGINAAVSFIKELPGKAKAALGNLGTLLLDSGKALIRGFIDGIKSMISNVANAVSGVVEKARSFFPFSPAKEGPFSGKGWVLYSGRSVGEAFAQGIQERSGLAQKATARMTAGAQAGMKKLRTGTSSITPLRGDEGPTAGGDYSVNIENMHVADPEKPIREIQTEQKRQRIKAGVI